MSSFEGEALERLKLAAEEMAFLVGRGYAPPVVQSLVSAHRRVTPHENAVLARAVLSEAQYRQRALKEMLPEDIAKRPLVIDAHDVIDLGKKFEDYGVESIIYTDIGRDGMLSGINVEATVKLAQALTIPVIASGGLSGMADIEALCEVEDEGIEGVICGRAIYSGDLDFEAAQERADELNG